MFTPRSVTLFLALFCTLAPSAFTQPDPPSVAAELIALRASVQPAEGEDGWPRFVAACEAVDLVRRELPELMGETLDVHRVSDLSLLTSGPWPRDCCVEPVAYVAAIDRSPTPAHLEALAASPRAIRPIDVETPPMKWIDAQFQTTAPARLLARYLVAKMRLASVRGDTDAVIAALDQALAVAQAQGRQLMLIDRIVAQAIAALALQELRHEVFEGLHGPEALPRLLDVLDRRLPLPAIEKSVEAELAYTELILPDLVRHFAPENAEDLERLARIMDALTERVRRLDEENGGGGVADLLARAWDDATTPKTPEEVAETIARSIESAKRSAILTELGLASTRTVILLEAYRADHGHYPESLDGLEAPIDPYTGRALCYLRRDPPADDAADLAYLPYLLYTPGEDGIDHGGREHPREDGHLPSPRDTGFDFVVTTPRSPLPEE